MVVDVRGCLAVVLISFECVLVEMALRTYPIRTTQKGIYPGSTTTFFQCSDYPVI